MKFFDIDGPLIQFLSKMADLMWLNILTVICCIPVITAGASLTAMHYMAIKIVRNEEGYITKGFFKAFKENFRQSTIIWLIFMVIAGVLFVDYRIVLTTDVQISNVVKALIVMIAALTLFTFMYVFPLQSKFSNTVKMTIRNAFFLSIMQWPKTILMIILYILPYVLIYVFPGLIPVILVFGLSIPALLSARLYNKFFLRMEEQILAQSGGNEEKVQEMTGEMTAEPEGMSEMADPEITGETEAIQANAAEGTGPAEEAAAEPEMSDETELTGADGMEEQG